MVGHLSAYAVGLLLSRGKVEIEIHEEWTSWVTHSYHEDTVKTEIPATLPIRIAVQTQTCSSNPFFTSRSISTPPGNTKKKKVDWSSGMNIGNH